MKFNFRKQKLLLAGFIILSGWLAALVAAPWLTPYGPLEQDFKSRLQPPTAGHWLGTDQLGRDVFARILFGARISLPVALLIVLAGSLLGIAIGAAAGFRGGFLDNLLMGVTEIFQTFPTIILAMVIAAALGPSLINAALALVLSWWPAYARLTRGLVLKLKEQEFVASARAIGAPGLYILTRAILPNALDSLTAVATLDLGNAVIALAGLSFLGLGAVPPEPEWGRMISEGVKVFSSWWVEIFPGLAMLSFAAASSFIGDGLRELRGES